MSLSKINSSKNGNGFLADTILSAYKARQLNVKAYFGFAEERWFYVFYARRLPRQCNNLITHTHKGWLKPNSLLAHWFHKGKCENA